MSQLTLIAPAGPSPPDVPAGYELRPATAADSRALGRLYFAAYDPGIACATEEEAVADVAATFASDYGPVWPPGTLAAWHGGDLAAAVMTTYPAPWDDTPRCPFVVELFTDRAHRRRGLASALLVSVLHAARQAEPPGVALRVDSGNEAAVALYRSLAFREWDPQS